MTSKSPVRSCEDVDETALSYAEIKALCAGNPLIAEKMNLDIDVARLRILKADYQSKYYNLEDDILKRYPKLITESKAQIIGLEADIKLYEKHYSSTVDVQMQDGSASVKAKFAGMVINGETHTEKEPAAKAILDACKDVKQGETLAIGSYMGFDMSLKFYRFDYKLLLRGSITHSIELGTDAFGNITRINNALAGLPDKLDEAKATLERRENHVKSAKLEMERPFLQADELAEKELRLVALNAQLNLDGAPNTEETLNGEDIADDDTPPKLSGTDFMKNVSDFNAGKRTDFVDDCINHDDEDIAV